ncbi:hypothetical protein TNCV_3525411 [Trichonephila clavipes]|uniref:Uncharacterized protein n=1 Tax=Trichonephila clavipes TaxID=2585209 RepID=A0A8X6S8K1_TRICX|nr:hypothetical protein TNCV_3525411 [Trichonephila clavipes]
MGRFIFNYNNSSPSINIEDCLCKNYNNFIDDHHKRVVTGNLDIINDNILKEVTNMAAMEDYVFLDALQKHCRIMESALMSKCNMNNQVREDARQALCELKDSIYKNFERVKSANFLEACKQT